MGALLLLFVAYSRREPPAPALLTIRISSSNGPLQVAPFLGGALLVLPDGTLWRWGQAGVPWMTLASVPERLGTNADWSFAAGGNNGFLALKTNGELWQFGYVSGASTMPSGEKWQRIGIDSDWVAAAKTDVGAAALKRDGTLWTWGDDLGKGSLGSPGMASRPLPGLVGTNRWRALALDGSNYGFVGLTEEGRLVAWGQPHQPAPPFVVPTAIHPGTNWVGVGLTHFLEDTGTLWAGPADMFKSIDVPGNVVLVLTNTAAGRYGSDGRALYEIRSDGSLWRRARSPVVAWGGGRIPLAYGEPVRVGSRDDWQQLWHGGLTVVGLTRDGTLWIMGTDWGLLPVPTVYSKIKSLFVDYLNRLRSLLDWPPMAQGTRYARPVHRAEPRPWIRLAYEPERSE